MRVFKEIQRFNQPWIILLLAVSCITPIVLLSREYLNGRLSILNYISTLSLIIVASLLIFFFKLNTKIDAIGVHYQFFPFHFSYKTWKWEDIKEVYTRKYDAISEFGGWGAKSNLLWKKSNGVAYNVSGDIGIQLVLTNGKKILIGTQKQPDADRCISYYHKKESHD